MSLRRVWAMRPAILVVRLLSIALGGRRVALVVALTLLSLMRGAIIAVVLLALAVASTVIVMARHAEG
jgi:hypothetical protein